MWKADKGRAMIFVVDSQYYTLNWNGRRTLGRAVGAQKRISYAAWSLL